MFEFFLELLFDGLFVGSEHILTSPEKKPSKWIWVRWVMVAICYTFYLFLSLVFVYLTCFLARELFFPKPGLEPAPLWMFAVAILLAGFCSWRTWRLTKLLIGAWQQRKG